MPGSARARSRGGLRGKSGARAKCAATWNKSVGPEGPPTARRKDREVQRVDAWVCVRAL
ncbi:DUF6053 domain-containing protein [Lysobacter enzymogenes]|uniref:DUF6053 domain-containing protein n=1 Tax=Lysobacter enzymogenes TaxID=69 RepID=UPI003D187C8D